MTLRRQAPEDGDFTAPAGRAGVSFFYLVLFLAGATLVFAVLAVRTAGFRELAIAQIQNWTETKVAIGGSRLGWPCDLVFTDLTVPADPDPSGRGLRIPQVRASWRPFRGLAVRLVRPAVRLARDPDGRWIPEDLAALGDIRDAAGVAAWLAPVLGRAAVRIERGTLELVSETGALLRRLEAVNLAATPTELPGRRAVHYRLQTGPMTAPSGGYGRLDQEWLVVEGIGERELAFGVDGSDAAGSRDYWKGSQP